MEITFSAASRSQLPALTELISAANDAPYDFAPVAEEKLFGVGFRGDPRVVVAESGGETLGLSVSTSRTLRILAVRRDRRGQGVGRALLRQAEQQARSEGHRRLLIGAEAGNYFTPGVSDDDQVSCRFFAREGYGQEDHSVDLRVDLSTASAPDNGTVQRAAAGDRRQILEFVTREFAASWAFEIERTLDADPPTLFMATSEGRLAGFAAIEANNRGLGSFGPEGVIPAARGKGIGRELLLHCLSDLRRLGYREGIVPWVSSIDFYQRSCGAEVAHRFTIYSKVL
jgi:mycothiol synthase